MAAMHHFHGKRRRTALAAWLVAAAIGVTLCAGCDSVEKETNELSLQLGFASGRPAVYFTPEQGMKVQLSKITYDKSDEASAYNLEMTYASGKNIAATLKAETDQDSEAYRYSAEIDGRTHMSLSRKEWKTTNSEGLIAFFPEGMGGYVIRGVAGSPFTTTNVTNRWSNDSGHRSFTEESFTHSGTTYSFIYSEHQRDDSGNLTGYVAELVTVMKADAPEGDRPARSESDRG